MLIYSILKPAKMQPERRRHIKMASVLFVLYLNIPGYFHNYVFLAKKQPICPYFAMVI